jgi:hypothetical protein
MIGFNYSYAGSSAANLLGGGFLAQWLSYVNPRVAATVVAGEFGALLVLAPAGLLRSGRDFRLLALAAVPAALALAYVQQPDRALWNFHFIVIPLAVIALQPLSNGWCALLIAAFAMANLRIGAQLRLLPPAGYPLAIAMLIAAVAVALTFKSRHSTVPEAVKPAIGALPSRRMLWRLIAVEAVAASLLGAIAIDLGMHNRAQDQFGVNTRGFRGPAFLVKPRGQRVAVLGGTAAYGVGVEWDATFPYLLQKYLGESPRRPAVPANVVNLAAIGDGAASYVDTLEHYAPLGADIIGIYDGYADPSRPSSRRASPVFNAFGYLPLIPAWMNGDQAPLRGDRLVWSGYDDDRGDVSAMSCERLSAAYCGAMIAAVDWALAHHDAVVIVTPPFVSKRHRAQQLSLAAELDRRFGGRSDVRRVNLGEAIDLTNSALAVERVNLTAEGQRQVAQRLVDPFLDVLADRREADVH